MSNITKNFKAKAKRGLCMAQGGFIDTLTGDSAAMNAGAGASAGASAALNTPQQNQPTAAGQPKTVAEPAQFGAAQFNTQDLMGMDRLTAGQYTNNPEILNAAMDAEGPKRYLDYSPAPGNDSRLTPAALPAPKRPVTQITAFADQGPSKLAQASKTTLGLRMADGGMVPETAEQVMARMANKYGTTGAAQAAPVAQPAPAPVQVQQPAPQPKPTGGLFGRALGGLRQANEQLRQVTNYAEGGIVRGKGGPTDDEVPMSIGGTDVNLSNKEAVLPAKTVTALGGPEAVEELIEKTNGKPPVSKGLRQGGQYAGGEGGWGFGSGQKPTIYDNGGLPAPVVQAGIETMRGQLANPPLDPNRPTDPDTDGRREYSTPTAPAFVNRAASVPQSTPVVAGYGNEGRSVPTAGSNPVSLRDRALVDNTLGKDAAVPQGLRGRWADNDPMKAQQFVSADNTATGLRNNPANGHGVVSIKQPDGSFKNVLMGPSEYTAADGSKTSDWSKTSQFAQGTEQAAKEKASLRDMQYQNAKFNATSDQITDPSAQAAGLRGLAQYDKEETTKAEVAKNKAAAENARIGHLLTEQGQRITLAGHKAMQDNTEKAVRAARDKDRRARAKDLLDMHSMRPDPKDGKPVMDHALRAELERAYLAANGGRLMDLPDEGPEGYEALSTQAINQARLSHAVKTAMQKDKAGWNFNNVFKKANTTLNAAEMSYDDSTDTLDVGGYKVKGKDVWGDDSDLANLVQTRKPKAQ